MTGSDSYWVLIVRYMAMYNRGAVGRLVLVGFKYALYAYQKHYCLLVWVWVKTRSLWSTPITYKDALKYVEAIKVKYTHYIPNFSALALWVLSISGGR